MPDLYQIFLDLIAPVYFNFFIAINILLVAAGIGFVLIKVRTNPNTRIFKIASIAFAILLAPYLIVLIWGITSVVIIGLLENLDVKVAIFLPILSPWTYYLGLIILFVLCYKGFKFYSKKVFIPSLSWKFALKYFFYIFTIIALIIFPLCVILYKINNNVFMAPSKIPQVCLSAVDSVGCKDYMDGKYYTQVYKWCEGMYITDAQKKKANDPLYKLTINDLTTNALVAKAAVVNGYNPKITGLTVYESQGTKTKVTSFTVENAGLLCINPNKGGYSYTK
jgi:hypothetical protein